MALALKGKSTSTRPLSRLHPETQQAVVISSTIIGVKFQFNKSQIAHGNWSKTVEFYGTSRHSSEFTRYPDLRYLLLVGQQRPLCGPIFSPLVLEAGTKRSKTDAIKDAPRQRRSRLDASYGEYLLSRLPHQFASLPP